MGHGYLVALVFLVGGCLDQEGVIRVEDLPGQMLVESGQAPVVRALAYTRGISAPPARCLCIDNETDAAGDPIVAGQDLGPTWDLDRIHLAPDDPPYHLVAFDSNHPTGGDTDLASPPANAPGLDLGNVLIVAENTVDADGDGLVDDPDDEANGGDIEIVFDDVACLIGWEWLDIGDNEAPAEAWAFDAADPTTPMYEAAGGAMADNHLERHLVQSPDWNGCYVHRLLIRFHGSGALDNLSVCIGGLDPLPEDDDRCF